MLLRAGVVWLAIPAALLGWQTPAGLLLPQNEIPAAAVTEVPAPPVRIAHYDIWLRADPGKAAVELRVTVQVHNDGPAPLGELDFDLLAREKNYATRVDVGGIDRLVAGKSVAQRFAHAALSKPDDPSKEGTSQFPRILRVTLSPPLGARSQVRLRLRYTLTHLDPNRKDLGYRLVAELPGGGKEFCLMADFPWLPQPVADFAQTRDLFRRNFYPRLPRGTWTLTLEHPAGYEGLVPDGRFLKVVSGGTRHGSVWTHRLAGLPQLLIGPSERVEVPGKAATVVFLAPKDADRRIIEANGGLLDRAYEYYSEWFGSLDHNVIQVAISSAGIGGHGAYLGMFVDAPAFRRKLEEKDLAPDRFFNETIVHELAHSWWGNSVCSYGRGTKLLREGFANYAAWHLRRRAYAADRFREALAALFIRGGAHLPLFEPAQDNASLAYAKGPLVLELLREELGDAAFFQFLKVFATRFKNKDATFTDFLAVLNDVSGRDWAPYLHHWCYGSGHPIYELLKFELRPAGSEFETSVTIRNSGKGIVRCPLELRMGPAKQDTVFRVPEGETRTLEYRTASRVEEVVIDPHHTAYQGDDREALRKALAVKESASEWIAYWQGLALTEQGQDAEALPLLSRAISAHETSLGPGRAHPAFYFSRGIAYLRTGDALKAEADVRRFLERAVGSPEADALRRLEARMRSAGLLVVPSADRRVEQLLTLLRLLTGQSFPADPALKQWAQWWHANRAAFRVSPAATQLKPAGFR